MWRSNCGSVSNDNGDEQLIGIPITTVSQHTRAIERANGRGLACLWVGPAGASDAVRELALEGVGEAKSFVSKFLQDHQRRQHTGSVARLHSSTGSALGAGGGAARRRTGRHFEEERWRGSFYKRQRGRRDQS